MGAEGTTRQRRRYMVWEWLAVLLANDGRCAYCDTGPACEMDHVIPFAAGGADGLCNLVPACRSCHRSKGDRTPPEWYVRRGLGTRWHGDGTLHGPRAGLRDLYRSAHQEIEELLDRLETVLAEVNDPARQRWLVENCRYDAPANGVSVAFWRGLIEGRLRRARAEGFPRKIDQLARVRGRW